MTDVKGLAHCLAQQVSYRRQSWVPSLLSARCECSEVWSSLLFKDLQ